MEVKSKNKHNHYQAGDVYLFALVTHLKFLRGAQAESLGGEA